MEKILKHDKYLYDLCTKLDQEYDVLFTHIPIYSRRNRLVAELDVVGLKEGICDVYEVKCSPRVIKASKQLKKIRKLMSLESKLRNTFFFCGGSGIMKKIE